MPTSDRWRAHRKLMGDTMTPAFLNNVVGPQMHRNALSMIELWREKARLARGHPFAAKDDIKAAAMDIIWAAAFGTQMKVADTQTSLLSGLSSIDLPADPEKEATLPSAPNPEAFDAVLTVSDTVRKPCPKICCSDHGCGEMPGSNATLASVTSRLHTGVITNEMMRNC